MEASAMFLLLAVLVAGATAGPAQWQASKSKCSTRCPESVKFKYETGWSYEYSYEAETRTTVAGAAQDTAAVTISATANIEVLDRCDMALRLTDVTIQRSHEEDSQRMVRAGDMSQARNALEAQTLRFAFYDGVVGDLCSEDEDQDAAGGEQRLWALNVKRGVLSAFQTSMQQLEREENAQEVDVTGQCPTHYKLIQQGWKSLTITKVKDILGCTNRHDHRTSLLSVPYSSPNSLQALPLMKTSHECTQDVSKEFAILERSSCHEVHVFRPFSKANSGAVTEASHTLTFRSKELASLRSHAEPITRRSTLLYEHRQGTDKGTSVFLDAKNKLQEICDATKVDIRPQVPRLFAELVHMMRSLDYSDLQDLGRQLKRNRICVDNPKKIKEFFQDALPMTATEASLRTMTGLLTSEEFSDAQATFWITSLAFVSNPTKDMISAVQPLLKDARRQQDAMLPVSALVNNYCERHADCGQHEEVLEVLDTLTTILGPDCQVQQDNFQQVLLTLRAIGNIGRSEAASLRLEKCFTHSDNPMDVRVAALDAYRRMPCSADRDDVMELFLRHSEDSELRIAAYLTVMQCPSDRLLAQVRQALQQEEVNQVGSFVWTHLTNLLETESPHKQAIRDVLENDLLQREFRKDQRKFSRNTEVSFFSGKFNLGGTYESNLVWSQNSFLPRSAMMNLTVDMFGHSVNLLELGGRVQGLEDILQTTLFGAGHSGKEGGYGQTDVVKNDKLVRTKANYGKVTDDFRGQLYLRVFGNELAFGTMNKGDLKQLTGGAKGKSFFDDLAKRLMSDGEVSFTQSAVFLDTTIIIPTVAGLPLNLTVNGSASVEVQASQKMDFKKINSKSKAFEVSGMLQPSGAVEVASTMSVDALVTRVGLRMTSRLHSSTAMKGRVELARGQILNVEIDTPRDTLEILDFQSKFYILHDDLAKEQAMLVAPGMRLDKRACSGQPLARVVGVELCASLSFPNATSSLSAPYFPLTGPTSFTLTLTKHDAHSGYKLLAKQIQTSSSVITQVALDTPGSKVDRAISLGYVANLKAKTLEVDLLSPWKKVSAQMSLKDTKKLTTAEAVVTIDTDTQYKVHAEVAKDIKNNKELIAKVKPFLEVTSNGAPLLSAKGSLDYRQDKMTKVSFVMDMKDVLRKPISLDYSLVKRERGNKLRYKNAVKLSSQFATVKSSVQGLVSTAAGQQSKKSSLVAMRAKVDYNLHFWPKVKRNVVSLGLKLNDRSTKALAKYGINMNLDSKQVPEASLSVNGEVSHKKTMTKVEIKVRHGQNVKAKADKSKELLLAGFVAHTIADPRALVSFDLKAIYPEKSIEYQLKGKHEHNTKEIEDYLTLRYAKGKSADAHLRLAQEKKKRSATFDLSYPAGENYPARTVKLNAVLTEKAPNHHVLSALASPKKGQKHSLAVSVERPTDRSINVSGELDIHGRPPIKLDLSGNCALRDMKGEGTLSFKGDTYRLAYTSDIQKKRYANFTASLDLPERKVRAAVEGGRDTQANVKRGKVEVLWDADKDPSQKVGVTVEMADKAHPEDLNYGGMVEVFTPVQDYKHLRGELRLENSHKRLQAVAETILGDGQREYSAKFLLARPLRPWRFKSQAWLKTPHPAVRHLELKADHSFEGDNRELSTTLKATFNDHSLQVGVSGSQGGDGVLVRQVDGVAFLKSTLPGAHSLRVTLTHRDDAGGRYTTQALADVNGDQYSATMEAQYTKVHYQISTNGEVNIRAPQLTSPVTLSWKHKNSLHDVTSSLTLQYPPYNHRVTLELEGTVNVVTKVYQAQVQLRGPWTENGGGEHVSKLDVTYAMMSAGFELNANLQLEKDTYVYHNIQKQTEGGLDVSTGLEMSRFPEYSYQHTYSLKYGDFPYTLAFESQLAKRTLLEVDMSVEKNPRSGKYSTTSRVILDLDYYRQKIVATTSHEKNRRGQWVNSGDIKFEPKKTISFTSVVDIEKGRKMVNLDVYTPFEEVRSIRLEYSHSGTVTEDFIASCSLTVAPLFDTVSTEVSWSRQDRFRANLRVALPIESMRYIEVKTQSWMEGGKRHSTLEVDHSPKQVYKLDTAYSYDLPRGYDFMVNISTPRPELPFLSGHAKHQYSGDEVSGLYKLASPVMPYDEISVSFNHRGGPKSFASQLKSVIGSGNTWTTRTEISWEDEIDGLFSVKNSGKGRNKLAVILSHKGHTYEDFRTKASFKMNGDRLESEVAYSNKDGREGFFMLATPDPDIDYFKTTFSQRLTEDKFEGRYTVQYGEGSKPYDLGLMTTYSDDAIAFSTDLKTPHSENLGIEIGFATKRRVEVKLLGTYGSQDKINVLVKYNIRNEFWDVGGDFEYMVKGLGRNVGLLFKRDGPLDNLKSLSTAKYMGKEITVDALYKDAVQKSGRVEVHSNFKDYTSLAASFNHSGDSENFHTDVYLKYKDDKEAKGSVEFQRNKWKRIQMTTTLNLPYEDFQENKLTYKQINRKNKVSAEGSLKLGSARAINGNLDFVDNSKLTVTVSGPYKDFVSFTATGTYDEGEQRMEGDARVELSERRPITATYMVRAGIWPVMVNVKARTPFEGWERVELTSTHDGVLTDFTSSHSLTSDFLGTVQSELIWTYTSPSALNGLWTMTSRLDGAENLKLSMRNTESGNNEYTSHLTVGWELLKEIVVDATVELPDSDSSNRYKGKLAMTTPLAEASQLSVSFDHNHDDRLIQDKVVAHFNDHSYLDADFSYDVGDRRVGRVEFREPRPMEFLIGARYSEEAVEGELKLNWDSRNPVMNIHLTGEYADKGDRLGSDTSMKVWVVHPARTMGMEYLMKSAPKEFQSDFLLTWHKSFGQTLSYVINWTDRSSRYSSAYDAMVKVGVPMRSVQVEGAYSDTGRARAAEGSLMWDADRDKNMKLGVKGQLDQRGENNQLQLGLDLPFIGKEYTLTTETVVNSGRTLLDARAELAYSPDPRRVLVLTARLHDLAAGQGGGGEGRGSEAYTSNYSLALGLVHPMTDLDVQLSSHVGSSAGRSSAAARLDYTTLASRTRQVLTLRGELDSLRRMLDVELNTPMKKISLEGQLTGEREYNLQLVSIESGQRWQVAHVFIDPETRTVETTFWYNKESPSSSVKLFGHLVNDHLLQTELYRMDNNQRVSETLMTLRLNSSHLLHTRLNWRPAMLRELQQYIGTRLAVFSQGSGQAFQSVAGAVGSEVIGRYQVTMQEVKEEARPLFEHFQRELETLQADLDSMQTGLRRFYYTNALHVQDMSEAIKGMLKSLVDGLTGLTLQFRLLQSQLQQDMAQKLQQMGQYPLAQTYAQLVADFAGGLKNSRVVMEQALDELSMMVTRFSEVTYRRYLVISRQIDRKLQGYTAALHASPHYQDLARLGGHLSSGNYRQLAEAANTRLLEALDDLGLKEPYLALVTRTQRLVADQFQDLVRRPEFQQIYVIGSELYQQGVWAYHYWRVEKNVQLAVGQLLKLAKDVTLLEITRIKDAVVDLDKSRVIVFDPQHGELQFELHLPVALKSLAEPPDVRVSKYINRVRSWVSTYIPSPRHSLWTAINSYLPSSDASTWLPPFTAHAFVMGDQHVVTFDRSHYNFAGRCSYVLARDMADDRFTVVLKYNHRPRHPQVESLLVLLRGVALEVDRDNKVKVNGQETELPFFSGVVSAVRHQSVVRVQDGQALTVEMDSTRGIYSVALSGWYHGRTAGLLGTFDNEPFNDLTDSNRQLTDDVEAFTNSWEVGRRYCRSRNLADLGQLDPEDEDVAACSKFLLDSSSYFSPCFGQVDAQELVSVCVSLARSAEFSLHQAQCRAGQHYLYMCGRLGIGLATPAECVSCELPEEAGERLIAGETRLLIKGEYDHGESGMEPSRPGPGSSSKSADVVFVVEESACNAWAQRSLSSVATQLSQALTEQGLMDNRFGMVSYAGNGSQDLQLVHTIEGQVFGDPSNFLKAAENLRLTYPSEPGDAEAALREAVQYPFRVGMAKMLVLLPCSPCQGDLYVLGQVLRSHGFVLHVLSEQNFAFSSADGDGDGAAGESANASPVRVFGVDSTGAHVQKSADRRSAGIYQRLTPPSDTCSRLALSTNGSVFDAGQMQSRSARIQKEFLKAFAARGALGATPPICERCTCHDDGTGRGHTVCQRCDPDSDSMWDPIPRWLQSSSTSVMGVFNDLHHQIITSLDVPEVVKDA